MNLILLKVFNKLKKYLYIFFEVVNIFDNKVFYDLDNIFKIKKIEYENIILFDHFASPNHQLIRSLLLNSLSKHYEGNLVCFNYTISPFLKKLYKIINVKNLIQNDYVEKKFNININKIYKEELKKISSKKKLMNYHFKGYQVGIDIYESYLRNYNKATIDLHDFKLKNLLHTAIKRIFFWENYFIKNNVKAISISHRNYLDTNLICKIGYKKKIPVFTFGGTGKRIGRFYGAELDSHKYLKNYYNDLSNKEKKLGVNIAKKQIKKRFNGVIGINMSYSTKSAFIKFDKSKKALKINNRIKVLICTNCFYDNPHAYGGNLFTDFYEWLIFLGKISHKTNYEWYIKPHPDYLPGTLEHIKKINKNFKNIELINPSTSFHQLAQEGIKIALTTYGSIAHELPLLGIDVINADIYNPHSSFDFSHTPKNLKEYKKLLMNLGNLESKIKNKNDIFKFYYIHHYFMNGKHSIISSVDKNFEKNYQLNYRIFYNYFIKSMKSKDILKVHSKLFNFFKSNFKYFLEKKKQIIINKYEKY